MAVKHKSTIEIEVGLDENKVPEKLRWTAPDGGVDKEEAKSVMLSVWDGLAQETLRIDLWTKDMPVDQMKVFIHQQLTGLADSYYRATQDEKMYHTMQDFNEYYAEKLELKGKEK